MASGEGLARQRPDFWPHPPRESGFPRRLRRLLDSRLRAPPERSSASPLPKPERACELDCLRGFVAAGVLAAAEQRGRAIGVGADRVLIAQGAISEEVYLQRLASHSGLQIERFADLDRGDCPLSDHELRFAARHRMLPVRRDGRLDYIHAPEGIAARRIAELADRFPDITARVRLATSSDFDGFLIRHAGGVLAHAAADGLSERLPQMSAAPTRAPRRAGGWRHVLRIAALAVPLMLAPLLTVQVCGAVLAIWFLLFNCLRLAGSFAPRPRARKLARLPDERLPVYTVMIALYREAGSVAPLLRALDALDYPREKLDIKLVIEPDDVATRAAIARLEPLPHIDVVIAPDHGPRTKPKALNYALTFARGTFLAVFDAEDRPDPGQLRAALDVFRGDEDDDDIACAQASLCIDNTADGWLARMFTAEYAGQFDVFLQGFSSFRMPLPLGGSSNHFRTAALRQIGGWDAYNVTEDADLGFRLARFGYRSVMFASTTYEEAPSRFAAWLRQRSRWMKGWMQTWIVHMRAPGALWREAGARGFFTLNIIVGGNVLTALAHPVLLGELLVQSVLRAFDSNAETFLASRFGDLHLATIAAGYFSTVIIDLLGLWRRRLLREAWVLALTPLYWIYLSLAAWRALYQLLRDPYRWEKTEHGLARHSRIASARGGAVTGSTAGMAMTDAMGRVTR